MLEKSKLAVIPAFDLDFPVLEHLQLFKLNCLSEFGNLIWDLEVLGCHVH